MRLPSTEPALATSPGAPGRGHTAHLPPLLGPGSVLPTSLMCTGLLPEDSHPPLPLPEHSPFQLLTPTFPDPSKHLLSKPLLAPKTLRDPQDRPLFPKGPHLLGGHRAKWKSRGCASNPEPVRAPPPGPKAEMRGELLATVDPRSTEGPQPMPALWSHWSLCPPCGGERGAVRAGTCQGMWPDSAGTGPRARVQDHYIRGPICVTACAKEGQGLVLGHLLASESRPPPSKARSSGKPYLWVPRSGKQVLDRGGGSTRSPLSPCASQAFEEHWLKRTENPSKNVLLDRSAGNEC